MTTWRQQFCGTQALQAVTQKGKSLTLDQIVNPSETMSHGGQFAYKQENITQMKTFKGNFVLPTDHYSILLFKDNGNAVIYSDNDKQTGDEHDSPIDSFHFSSSSTAH